MPGSFDNAPWVDPTLTLPPILSALLRAEEDGVVVVDGTARVRLITAAAARALGAPGPAALAGREVFALLSPAIAEDRRDALARVAACGVAETLEDQDGGLWWRVRILPLTAEGAPLGETGEGSVPLLLVLLRDVTEARALDLALRDSEERFRSAFDAAGHGMALVGLDGRFLMANPTLQALLGLDPARPGDLAATVFPGDMAIARDLIRRLAAGREPAISLRMRFLDARGEPLWGLVTASLHRPRLGEPPYVIMHLRDVTEEQRAEDRLRAAKDEADRASRAKTRFLAAASHDLRQPLQALGMFVSVLATRETDPQNAAIVGRIDQTLGALTGLLNTLLDISKLDAGLMRCDPRDAALGPLLTHLVAEAQPVAAARGLGLRAVASSARAFADPALVDIVLRNFLGNALRYTQSGRVLLGVRHRPKGAVEIQVLDTGPGIPPDQQALVFEDFHQVDNPAREKGEGLGLGLAIVRRVAALMGAQVTLASHPGRGSCFGLVLPAPLGLAAGSDADGLMRADPAVARGLTVMVIDDDPAILDGLTLMLEHWDCEVLAFEDIAGLREGLDSGGLDQPPDLILADYRLGGAWTGVDAVEMIRAHVRSPVPALLLSGDTAPQRLREADASGLPLLHKPVRPEVLRGAIADAITGGLTLTSATDTGDGGGNGGGNGGGGSLNQSEGTTPSGGGAG